LLREMGRVLKPEGTLAIIEHNPYNPVTLLIVSRTPVDADAILLRPDEILRLYREAGLRPEELRYFLYLPEWLFQRFGRIEGLFSKLPLGGQYVVFGRKGSPQESSDGASGNTRPTA
jgi:SAM-dependent methyltransferase